VACRQAIPSEENDSTQNGPCLSSDVANVYLDPHHRHDSFKNGFVIADPIQGMLETRLTSLDAFRGMTIVAMILVNTPGSWDHVYPQLLHAEWVGPTFTDLIFPFFLFIAGVAMWFSFGRVGINDPTASAYKILRRVSLIFLVGLFISWFPFYDLNLDNLMFAGVLQRIAVSYLIASAVCLILSPAQISVCTLLLLLAHWGLTGWSGAENPYEREVVLARGIDYLTFTSSISSATLIMIGYLVGKYIDRSRYDPSMYIILTAFGIGMMLLGAIWSAEFPIVKSVLWSSSYVAFTAGLAVITFAVCHFVVERLSITSWTIPFLWFGVNPLFLYVLSILLDKVTWIIRIDGRSMHTWVYESIFQPLAGDADASLMYALCFVALHLVVAWWLFRKRMFIKI